MLILGQLSNRDGIESEVSDYGEYREIVVYLRVEPISRDIEISSEDLDEEYRDQRGRDFAADLSQRVGVYFFGGHR